VRITLIEKGVPYGTSIVDLSRMEQKKPEYLALNPNGVVPTLVHGDRVVYESNVITEYLDDVFPDLRLYPEDPWERAQVKLWQAFELSFAKDYRPLMYQRLLGPIVRLTRTLDEALEIARRSTTNPFDLEWERKVWGLTVLTPDEEHACAGRLYQRVSVLEHALAASDYLVGNRFTQAEVSVFPRLRMYPYVQLPITSARFPCVAAWMARLEQRPSFEKSLFESERGMQRLSDTSVVPWLAARLKKARPNPVERAGLALAKRFFRRAMRGGDTGAARRQVSQKSAAKFTGTHAPNGAATPPTAAPFVAPFALHESPLSPSSRRVGILLRALGLSWTSNPVDIARMEHKRAEFLGLNPNGEVPVLRHGERVLYDSALICEYLDATFTGGERPSFFPSDALTRAQAKMWIAYDQALHKEWRPLLYQSVIGPLLRQDGSAETVRHAARQGGLAEGQAEWIEKAIDGRLLSSKEEELARAELLRKLERVEAAIASSGYLGGSHLTVADMAWFSRIEMYPALGLPVDATRFPSITYWLERLRALPVFAP